MRIACLLLSPVLLLCGTALQAETASTPEAGVVSTIEAYDRAWNRKDAAAFEHLLSADYVYFTSKGDLWPRRRWLDFMLSPKYELVAAQRSEIDVHRTGDTAVVGTRWRGHGSYDGKPFRDDQRCSLVLAQSTDGWKVLSEHCVQIVAD